MAASAARRNSRSRNSSSSCGAPAFATGSRNPREAVELTLDRIAQGGIYDHLGGGFARYSVDERWLVPHFEKMLYDNAQLIELMTEAGARPKSPLYAQRIAETIDWLLREMMVEGGGLRLVARRRQRRRGGEVLCLEARRDRGRARRGRREALRRNLRRDGATGISRATTSSTGSARSSCATRTTEARLAAMREKLLRAARDARASRLRRQGARRLERPDDRRTRQCGGCVRPRRLARRRGAGLRFRLYTDDVERPAVPRLSRRRSESAGDGQRLRQHDQGSARSRQRHGQAALYRRKRANGPTCSTGIIGRRISAATTSPPTIPSDLIVRPFSGQDDATPNANG